MDDMNYDDNKVLVAMSGGVDSAAAAALLQQQGREVTGVYLCLEHQLDNEAAARTCCSPFDAQDARRAARVLGIELTTLPATVAFGPIVDDFVSEYKNGRTPNPCVHCNTLVKFGLLFDLADSIGIRFVATGHYARMLGHDQGDPHIARASDLNKDQSYVLFGVDPKYLPRMLMPVGEVATKDQVRNIARNAGVALWDKPDSQEVCFVPDNDYVSLLKQRAPEAVTPGEIVDSSGKLLGKHDGYGRYTIGQRRGLRIAAKHPLYVTKILPETATVVVGPQEELLCGGLRATGARWHSDVPDQFTALVQIRYKHKAVEATVRVSAPDRFEVRFHQPVAAIAPGW
jgi:tRNA-uridine 2-sulfurtransferase